MTGGPSGKKRGPGDLRSPAGAQHARLKRENTAKLPKGVTGVILGGKPGTHTVGGKKVVQITQKQMDALHAAKRSAEADRKKTYKEPAWLRADEGGKAPAPRKEAPAPRKEGIIESIRQLIVAPIKRNIERGYIDIFKHPLGSRDPRIQKKASRESKRKTSRQSNRGSRKSSGR